MCDRKWFQCACLQILMRTCEHFRSFIASHHLRSLMAPLYLHRNIREADLCENLLHCRRLLSFAIDCLMPSPRTTRGRIAEHATARAADANKPHQRTGAKKRSPFASRCARLNSYGVSGEKEMSAVMLECSPATPIDEHKVQGPPLLPLPQGR